MKGSSATALDDRHILTLAHDLTWCLIDVWLVCACFWWRISGTTSTKSWEGDVHITRAEGRPSSRMFLRIWTGLVKRQVNDTLHWGCSIACRTLSLFKSCDLQVRLSPRLLRLLSCPQVLPTLTLLDPIFLLSSWALPVLIRHLLPSRSMFAMPQTRPQSIFQTTSTAF